MRNDVYSMYLGGEKEEKKKKIYMLEKLKLLKRRKKEFLSKKDRFEKNQKISSLKQMSSSPYK